MNSDVDPPTEGEELRREAAEIIRRRHRGLPAYRAARLPVHASPDLEMAEQGLAEARGHFAARRFAEALLQADAVTGHATAHTRLWEEGMILRAQVYLEQRSFQAARDSLRRILSRNPGHVEARLHMADSFRRTHQYQQAIKLYVETIPLIADPEERSRWYVTLADTYTANGQPHMARRVLRRTERPGVLTSTERARAAFSVLIPDSPAAWIILALSLGASAYVASTYPWPVTLLTVALCMVLYGVVQWVRTPLLK